ncbi:MAG: nuclear transport factor 2 family protein [Bryobacteraceae bacterium]|nr:nuclear transport factor 2 family protein [Bryobacteraceae bacterium]
MRDTATAFAKSITRRDLAGVRTFLAPDAILHSPGGTAVRGPAKIAEAWGHAFGELEAPFAREAEAVHVLSSGTLALVTGPVRDASGKQVRTFNSVWRRGANGRVQLTLDYACPACNCGVSEPEPRDAAGEVWRSEAAFAKTMADRDHVAFSAHVAEDAVFIDGAGRALQGREQVASSWRHFYEAEKAPFSWRPERVLVLESGELALSQGPVRDPDGKRIGTFASVWRKDPDGRWRVVFDRGCEPCDCP